MKAKHSGPRKRFFAIENTQRRKVYVGALRADANGVLRELTLDGYERVPLRPGRYLNTDETFAAFKLDAWAIFERKSGGPRALEVIPKPGFIQAFTIGDGPPPEAEA